MKNIGIEAAYPAGRFDKNLNIIDGNHSLHEFMGSFIYLSLYKMVHNEDLGRLKDAIERCRESGKETDECVRMQTASGKYERCIVNVCECESDGQVCIELFNISQDWKKMVQMNRQLALSRDYLTLVGDILSEYCPANDSFRLFLVNDEQTVDFCNSTLEKWKAHVLAKNQIAKEDCDIFTSICESMKRSDNMHTYSFSGSIFTNGDHIEKYQVKFLPRYYDDEKVVLGLWSVMTEARKSEYSNYVEDSYVDSLTRLLNKKTVTEYAQRVLEEREKQLAIVVMDIDNFKNINDTYGHLFGDQVIRQTGDVLKKVVGNHGVAGRIGGDEFMLVIENFYDEVNLRNYLRSIKQNIAILFQDKLTDNPLSCSIGVARNDVVPGDFKELFMTADKALYIAKQKGKNRYVIFKPEMHGQFNVSDNPHDDMLEIRKSYYSNEDIRKINELLSKAVIYGKEIFPELLSQASNTFMVNYICILWNDGSNSVTASSDQEQESSISADAALLKDATYLERFHNDIHIMTNSNSLEYNYPKAYQIYKESGVLSTMQHLLRDQSGEIRGIISADKCDMLHSFPKIAIQIFENMCQVVNGILIRDR